METTLIAVAGGTIGLLLGASMSRLIASFAGWSTIISGGSLALAFSVSVLIGLVSGVYPAMKAAAPRPGAGPSLRIVATNPCRPSRCGGVSPRRN